MTTPADRNWIDEQDIFDRHLFGKLSETESSRFQRLMGDDADLRQEWERHVLIVAALRQAGRDGIKQRLKSNLGGGSARTFAWPVAYKIAAALLITGGLTLVGIRWFSEKPQVANAEPPKEQSVSPETIVNTLIEEKVAEMKQENQDPMAKRATKITPEKKVMPNLPPGKNARETQAMPLPHEVTVRLTVPADNLSMDTRILFNNPLDLAAINIRDTQKENGRLEWFYVLYQNRLVHVYLDHAKYLKLFQGASLTESGESLKIQTASALYVIDLRSSDKFRKAVIH